MTDLLDRPDGTRLGPKEYIEDFWPRYKDIENSFLKIERLQHFSSPEDPAWLALFSDRDWERSLELTEQWREGIRQHYSTISEQGIKDYRLRIVEYPISPYVQWEFHILKMRVEAGENSAVLWGPALEMAERAGRLPECVFLSDQHFYEVIYDSHGNLEGADRIDDRSWIAEARAQAFQVFYRGESLLTFFDREIAPLPPPQVV